MSVNQSPVKIVDFQKPEEILALVENEKVRDLIALITMGQGVVKPDGRPEWVIRAANEFWRCCFDFPKTKRAKSEAYRFGYQWGLVRSLRPESMGKEKAILALLNSGQLDQLIHSAMQNSTASEAADFYAGLSDGISRQTLTPSSPVTVYLLLTVMWSEMSKFKNTTEIHAWLENILGPNLTGQRDRVAKLLQKIRFPLTDKGGRPKGKPRKRLPN